MTRHTGLWDDVLDAAGVVDRRAWRQAADTGQYVGTCRDLGCLGQLKPQEPLPADHRGLVWYPAVCTVCHKECSHHGPVPGKG